jgi:uncharacterized protein (TIGR00369 family)
MNIDYDNLAQMITSGIPHVREIGVTVTQIGADGVTVKVDQQDRFIGDPETGIIHGGIITVLLDTVSGMSVHTAMAIFAPVATLDLRIDYLKPARPKSAIYAHAHCYKVTRSVAFTRGVAYQDSVDDPIAHSTGTFMLSESGQAQPYTGSDDEKGTGAAQ